MMHKYSKKDTTLWWILRSFFDIVLISSLFREKVTMAIEEIFSFKDAFFLYKHLADYQLQVLKRQSKCEFFYWKSLGIVFVLSLACFILQDYGFAFSPFVGIVFAGVSTFLMLLQNIGMDFEYSIQTASYVEQGLSIEKKFEDPSRLFQIFEENKVLTYKGNLISILLPTGLIALVIAFAGVILSLKVSVWLAIVAGLTSTMAIYSGLRSYLKVIRKIFFGVDQWIHLTLCT